MFKEARELVIGSRKSALALTQSNSVKLELMQFGADIEVRIHELVTKGDKVLDQALPEIGGKGLFTAELEAALKNNEIDLAVHSLKDLPTESDPDLIIAAVPEREAPHDILVSKEGIELSALPHGACVGTSSLRRQAQLLKARPDLKIISLRGNIDTRVRKALNNEGGLDAVVLAQAGILRLERSRLINPNSVPYSIISLDLSLPAPAQGALGIQCRRDDHELIKLLSRINHAKTRSAVEVERAFLAYLNAGCSTPVAALATWQAKTLYFRTRCLSPDGKQVVEASGTSDLQEGDISAAQKFGVEIAEQALLKGAAELLAK